MGKTARSLTVKLPPGLEARLAAAAAERGMTRSALIREALETILADGHQRRASFLALARDLHGCLEGPGDLSYNPRHMRGYGR